MRSRPLALAARFLVCVGLTLSFAGTFADSGVPSPEHESEYNRGVEAYRARNYVEARRHWRLAAQEPHPAPEVYNNLGYLLHEGLGGDEDLEGGVALWRKGAELAVSESQMHLGVAYRDGTGVDADPVQAYAWTRCALATSLAMADQDDTEIAIRKDINRLVDELLATLSPAERAAGERLGERYTAQYSKRQAP